LPKLQYRLRLAAVLVPCLVAWPPTSAASRAAAVRPPIGDLTRRLQARYDTVRDFSADFVHVYEGGLLRRKVTERGKVLIKKPGRMRWTYTSPEPKEFVSDGTRLYAYVPQDRQVIVSAVPAANEATSAVLFLAGKGRLARDFAVDYADATQTAPGTLALKLVPHEQQADYDWLILVVDRQTLAVRSLITADAQGGRSTFTFSNLKENIGLADSRFEFKIPRGVDVVTDAGRGR
jgi:outer membrane lipoprotein carrier protein